MATTLDVILGRVRSLCLTAPFSYTEAVSTESFAYDPTLGDAAVVKVQGRAGTPRGGFDFNEECTDSLDIEVSRPVTGDYRVTHATLQKDARSLTAAVVRDGVQVYGEYTVPDAGRTSAVIGEKGAAFLTLRLTLPVNYMSTL
jgi:hypothetical protein